MKSLLALIFALFYCGNVLAQVGIGTATPNANAVLELKSPGNNQGFLLPRLTTAQRNAIALTQAENGLMVFDSDDQKFYYWQGAQWLPIRSGNDINLQAGAGIDITGNTISAIPDGDGDAANEIQDLELNGNTLTITNNAAATNIDLAPFAGTNTDNQTLNYNAATGLLGISGGNNVTITSAGAAGGILSGTYPNPSLAATSGNAVITALNNGATTGIIGANRLPGTVVLDTESPTGGAISGNYSTGLQINDLAVTTAKINNGAVTSVKLATTGVTAATYGAANLVPQIAVDAQGRITSATTVTISGVAPGGAASGDLAGSYPNPSIATGAGSNIVTAVNSATTTNLLTSNRLASNVVLETETPTASDIAGSFSAGLSINNNAVTTAKINNAAVTTVKIAPSATAGQVLTTVAGAAVWANLPAITGGTVTNVATGSGLTGGPITTTGTIGVANNGITSILLQSDAATDANRAVTSNHIRNAAVSAAKLANTAVTPGSYGSATQIPTFTVDPQGRLTAAGSVAISGGIAEGLAETLAASGDAKTLEAYNLKSISINTGAAPGAGALNVNGSHYVSFTMFGDGYVVKPEDYILISDPGKGAATIDLPKAADSQGRILIIRSTGRNLAEAVTVRAAEGLDGSATSEPLYLDGIIANNVAYSLTIISNGSTWLTIDRAIADNRFKG